jgi:hypothetical protein
MRGEEGSCGVLANEYSCAHGAQINFGDLTPYLTYGLDPLERNPFSELYEGNPVLYFCEGSPVLDPQAGDPMPDLAWYGVT